MLMIALTFHALTGDAVYGYIKVAKRLYKPCNQAYASSLGHSSGQKRKSSRWVTWWWRNTNTRENQDHFLLWLCLEEPQKQCARHAESCAGHTKAHVNGCGTQAWPLPQRPRVVVQVQQGWAKNEEPPPYKNRLPEFVCEVLETVFRWLNDEAPLERCSDGITQIPSKSLDTMMREQVQKVVRFSRFDVFTHRTLPYEAFFYAVEWQWQIWYHCIHIEISTVVMPFSLL